MNDTATLLTLLGCGLLAYLLVTCVLYTLASWSKHHLDRHNLIVDSKLKRIEYLRSLQERQAVDVNVDVLSPEEAAAAEAAEAAEAASVGDPAGVFRPDEMPMAQAA